MKMTKAEKQAKWDADILLSTKFNSGEISREVFKNELIKLHYNLPDLVLQRLRKSLKSGPAYDDMIQAGFYGMLRAFEKFDTKKGVAFFSYAETWAAKYIYEEIAKLNMINTKGDKDAKISCFLLEDYSTLNEDELTFEDFEEAPTLETSSPDLAIWLKSHKEEIKVFTMFFIDGVTMTKIAENERITISKVKKIIRGQRNSKGEVTCAPFFTSAKKHIQSITSIENFQKFKKYYINS